MTESVTYGAPTYYESLGRFLLVPIWVRPVVATVIVAAHISAFVTFAWLSPERATPLPDIAIQVVPFGETVTETSTSPTPDAAPVVTSEPASLISPNEKHEQQDTLGDVSNAEQPEKSAELAAIPPRVESKESPPIAVEEHPPLLPKTEPVAAALEKEPVTISKRSRIKQQSASQSHERTKQQRHAPIYAAQVQRGAPAIRAGTRDGSSQTSRMAQSSYGALVSAEINRHKTYPASARAGGITGNVAVVFTVGSSGVIVSHRIARSSGNPALDASAHAMMSAARPPPPPGGRFVGSVTIRFNLSG
jgi:protein TonB